MMRISKVSFSLLTIAGLLSVALTWLGVTGLWFFGLGTNGLSTALVLVVPVLALPFFLIVFRSINLARVLMWLLVFTSVALTAFRNRQHIIAAVASSRINEILLAIAVLMQVAYFFIKDRRRTGAQQIDLS